MATETPALFLSQIERRYPQTDGPLEVLRGAISRSGRASSWRWSRRPAPASRRLLHIAGLLEKPDAGEVFVGGVPTSQLDDEGRTTLRRIEIGFVYQFHHLLPEFTALENVDAAAAHSRPRQERGGARATELLSYLGLGERLDHRPSELSGGEQQRVAIAPRRRQRAAHPAGRRADGQSRPAHLAARVRHADGAVASPGLAALIAHPQSRPRRAHGPAGHDPRRAGGAAGLTFARGIVTARAAKRSGPATRRALSIALSLTPFAMTVSGRRGRSTRRNRA